MLRSSGSICPKFSKQSSLIRVLYVHTMILFLHLPLLETYSVFFFGGGERAGRAPDKIKLGAIFDPPIKSVAPFFH